jgi:hypothetical protein
VSVSALIINLIASHVKPELQFFGNLPDFFLRSVEKKDRHCGGLTGIS